VNGPTCEALALTLPAPLDEATDAGAWTEYGKRTICWTLGGPGTFRRNAWVFAWVQVTEQEPWRGEPLWLSAERRIVDASHLRQPFTTAARAALSDAVLPVVARYGFGRLWLELHRTRTTDAAKAAERARIIAAWHDARETLHQMHVDGLVDFHPIERDHYGRPPAVRVVGWDGRLTAEPAAARATVHGEHVGWMTDRAVLVPLGDLLEEAW
jgi:hypothetical protein